MSSYYKNFQNFFDILAERKSSLGGGSVLALNFCLGIALLEKALNTSKKNSLSRKLKKERKKVYKFIDLDGYLFLKLIKEKDIKKRLDLLNKLEKISFYLINSSYKILEKIKKERKDIKKVIKVDFCLGTYLLKIVIKGCIKNLEINRALFSLKKGKKDLMLLKKKLNNELGWVKF